MTLAGEVGVRWGDGGVAAAPAYEVGAGGGDRVADGEPRLNSASSSSRCSWMRDSKRA